MIAASSTTLAQLADEWDGTAARAEQFCAGDDLFQGEARGLRSAAKELREYIASTIQNEGSYADAFYEIAAALGIGARNDTPSHVFHTVMLPKIKAMVAAAPERDCSQGCNGCDNCTDYDGGDRAALASSPHISTVVHEGMTIAGDGAAMLGRLMREQRASSVGVYPDGNPNASLASSPAVPRLPERMELANHLDSIARSLSYNGEKREGDAKHRLYEIVASLGGTGILAALSQTEPPARSMTEADVSELRRVTAHFAGDWPDVPTDHVVVSRVKWCAREVNKLAVVYRKLDALKPAICSSWTMGVDNFRQFYDKELLDLFGEKTFQDLYYSKEGPA